MAVIENFDQLGSFLRVLFVFRVFDICDSSESALLAEVAHGGGGKVSAVLGGDFGEIVLVL
jgi:hypothetical protein